MAAFPQDLVDAEQQRQMQQMQAFGNGLPGIPGLPGMPSMPGVPGMGMDPAMAQAYMHHMLTCIQQGMQQQGFPGATGGMGLPPAPFPGMAPCPPATAGSTEPTVRVSVEGMKFQYQLTEDDIHKVFRRYGKVQNVTVDEACSSAMVTFQNAQEAQAAISDLDGKVLSGLDGTLRISWVSGGNAAPPPPYSAMPPFPGLGGFPQAGNPTPWPPGPAALLPSAAPEPSSTSPGESRTMHVKGARKYTCRFLIGIENDKEFQVARRLIGSKGSNMKRIVRQTEAKLRLRGVGSGYFEGASQKESPEPLQLCVSCTSIEGYKTAVHQVKELLQRVYEDYRQFCRENNQPVPDLQINLSENQLVYSSRAGASPGTGAASVMPVLPGTEAGKGSGGSQRKDRRMGRGGSKRGGGKAVVEGGDRGEPGPNSPPEEEILQLINERNEARRSCNFAEADRIRELLHSRGVALMDEPGGRGKGAEVTTWRYWRD
mmetsp:Transcript_31445/g.72942  ORF Transcript_31445/g.72942 Transcript_31445/m.72942 type:complete len:485 (+) Transcript_31445:91-1545(+)